MNNDLVKGKDVLQDMVVKLEEKKKKYKETVKTLGKVINLLIDR